MEGNRNVYDSNESQMVRSKFDKNLSKFIPRQQDNFNLIDNDGKYLFGLSPSISEDKSCIFETKKETDLDISSIISKGFDNFLNNNKKKVCYKKQGVGVIGQPKNITSKSLVKTPRSDEMSL